MADWWDVKQRWRRRWQRWQRQGHDRLQAWRGWVRHNSLNVVNSPEVWWHSPFGNSRKVSEVHMDMDTAAQEAMGKVVMAQMQQQTLQSLKAAMRQEMLDELRDEALELAKIDLEDELGRRRATLDDRYAKQARALDDEFDARLEAARRQIREEFRDTLEERALVLQDERDQARAERDQAEGVVLSLLQQMCGERRVWLHSSGIQELDLVTVNTVLARHRLRLRSERGFSERLVKTRTAEATWEARSRFWLEALTPGVVEAEDRDGSVGKHTYTQM